MTSTLIAQPKTQPISAPTPAVPARRPAKGSARRGFVTLFRTELKIWLRGLDALWVLFPTGMLLMNAFMGGGVMGERAYGEEWTGSAIYGYAPITGVIPIFIGMALAMTTVGIMPTTFGALREKGVLKVFSASPMRPQALFGAHFLINGMLALAGAFLAVGVAFAMFPIAVPQNAALVAGGLILGVAAMLAIGTLISGLVGQAKQGTLFANLAFFVLIVTAGAMGGVPEAGSLMYNVARVSPLGAAVQVMNYGWLGSTATLGEPTAFPWIQLVAMVLWTGVLAPLAVKLFRWR